MLVFIPYGASLEEAMIKYRRTLLENSDCEATCTIVAIEAANWIRKEFPPIQQLVHLSRFEAWIKRNVGYKLAYLLAEAGYLPESELRQRVLSYLDDEKRRKEWRELGLSTPGPSGVGHGKGLPGLSTKSSKVIKALEKTRPRKRPLCLLRNPAVLYEAF